MSEQILHNFPGQAAAAVTKGAFGKWDSAGKIAKCSVAGEKSFGVIARTVSAAGEATSLKYGIVEMTASGTVTAGDKITPAVTSGAAKTATKGSFAAGYALSTATDGNPFLAFVPMGGLEDSNGMRRAFVSLTGDDIHGGVQSWANPESGSILITRLVIDASTKSTGAATLDAGTTATSATTASDNLIDGLDIGTAAGVFCNLIDNGTNGKSGQTLASGKWVTFKEATGDTSGAVIIALIEYQIL